MKRGVDEEDNFGHGSDAVAQRRRVALDDTMLQEAIKVGQRASVEWKESWHHWCEIKGHTIYDPTKYSGDQIKDFFKIMGAVYLQTQNEQQGYHVSPRRPHPEPVLTGRGGASLPRRIAPQGLPVQTMMPATTAVLVDLVKTGQRNSPAWKEQWTQFCHEYAGGSNDPRKQLDNPIFFLAFFFQYGLGTLGSEEWAHPFLSAVSSVAMPFLVDAIKNGQRQHGPWKEAWISYVQQTGSQFRDPNRHEAGSLMQFMDTVAMTQFKDQPWMRPFVVGAFE